MLFVSDVYAVVRAAIRRSRWQFNLELRGTFNDQDSSDQHRLVCRRSHHRVGSEPPASAEVVAGKNLSVRYSAPSVRGRKIFGDGGLLSRDPTYPAWRAGANSATTFHTDADLDVGGLAVPKGTYTLYVWVKDPDNWQLIINKQTGQWGLSYASSQDLGRQDDDVEAAGARRDAALHIDRPGLGQGRTEARLGAARRDGADDDQVTRVISRRVARTGSPAAP